MQIEPLLLVAVICYGLVAGSFMNACIYRVPRKISLWKPGSFCPACSQPLRFYDLVPLLSYAWYRGSCRSCCQSIPVRYPLVELGSAGIFLVMLFHFQGQVVPALPYALLGVLLLGLSVIDLEYMIVPNLLVFSGWLGGVVAVFLLLLVPTPGESLLGFLVGGGLLLSVALLSKGGMGGGDVKLAALIGLFVGWSGVLLVIMLAATLGSAVGVLAVLFFDQGKKTKIPFVPFLSIATILTICYGDVLFHWYWSFWW